MAYEGRTTFTPEELAVAKHFVIQCNSLTIDPWDADFPASVAAFDSSLLLLARFANAVAEERPDSEEFEALRWVHVAKLMVRQASADLGSGDGLDASLLFDEVELETQADTYYAATGRLPGPFEDSLEFEFEQLA